MKITDFEKPNRPVVAVQFGGGVFLRGFFDWMLAKANESGDYCGPVPTVKISTNTPLAKKKAGWIDFDAGVLLDGADREILADRLFDQCIAVAEGRETRGEQNGYCDIAIFKDGVIL